MGFHLDSAGILRWRPWAELPWLVHGFSTVGAGDFHDEACASAGAKFGGAEMDLKVLRQVHSDRVFAVDEVDGLFSSEGDGLIATRPETLAGVRTADCSPILLLDRRRRAAAAVHAGWRGAAAQIAARAVERLTRQAGSTAAELEAVIGPSIGAARYEVGEEVAERFDAEVIRREAGRPRPHLDLAEANRRSLLAAGLRPEAVTVAPYCTFEDAELFYSWRRQGPAAGRMLSVIGVRETRFTAASRPR